MQVTKEYSGVEVTVNEEDLGKSGIIYLLSFPNGKVYVGQTTQKLKTRLVHHCYKGSRCHKVKRALQKYKQVTISVLQENMTLSQLNSFESFYIRLFNSMSHDDGYNLNSGGMNKTPSQETLIKLSESHKGKKQSNEQIEKRMKHLRGKPLSDEHKKKMSESRKGCVASESTKEKQSQSAKNRGISEETRRKMSEATMVKVMSIPDNIVFESITAATKYYKIDKGTIRKSINTNTQNRKTGQIFVKVED